MEKLLKKYIWHNEYLKTSDAMNKWKNSARIIVNKRFDNALQNMDNHNDDFEQFRQKAKQVNVARCFKYYLEINKSNIFRAWINGVEHVRLMRVKTRDFKEK